jgi:hypothetical protein
MWEKSNRDLLSTMRSWIAEEKLTLEFSEGGIRAGEDTPAEFGPLLAAVKLFLNQCAGA